jgi:hypothetical protein
MKKLILIIIAIFSLNVAFGQTIFVDDFNRADSQTVGNSWNEYTTTNGGQIYTNRLRLGSANSGKDYVSRDLSGLTNPIITDGINNNTSILEWAFNFKGSRTNPSGFNTNNYGYGFILGNTVNNAIGSGQGYAVVIGQSGSSDPIRLAKFTGGVNANSDFTDIISSGDYGTQYISVKVTFDPATDTWSLYAESNSSNYPQTDPRDTSTLLGTAVDNTYVGAGNDLKYCGAFYNHPGNNDFPQYYDDVYMPVPSGPQAPTSLQTNCAIEGEINVTWTKPAGTYGTDWDGVVVFARETSANDADPSDNDVSDDFAADLVYGLSGGDENSECMAIQTTDTDGNIIITGLTAGSTYNLIAYTYKDNGGGIDTWSSATTEITPAATAIAGVTAATATTGTRELTLNWTNPDMSCYSNVVIIAREGSAVHTDHAKVNFDDYVDDSDFVANIDWSTRSDTNDAYDITVGGTDNTDYVVYNGTGNSATITGLKNGATYHFRAFVEGGESTDKWSTGVDFNAATNQPTITFDTATSSLLEGDSGTTTHNVSVTMDIAPDSDVDVEVYSGGNTASDGSDYDDISTTITFSTTDSYPKTINVPITIYGDIEVENDETFDVVLDVVAAHESLANEGTATHTVTITNDDSVEIEIQADGEIIVNGNTMPESILHTDFGNVHLTGGTVTEVYTINNFGNADLHLTDASPYISITGTNAADFSLTTIPTSPITGGNTTTFSITFDPSAIGLREATISIANNDSDENPYNFNIQGTGYTPCSQLFISEYGEVNGGNYFEIYNPTNAAVDMSNFQVWRALNGGAWSGAGTTQVVSLGGTGTAADYLAPGNVWVVARDPADIPFANTYDPDMNYNGDDNIGLAWNGGSGSTFHLIDAVGDDQGDPGIGWDVAGTTDATLNHTLVRKSTVDTGNTDWTISAGTNALDSEWIVLDYTTNTHLYHVSDCQQIPLMAVVGHLLGAGNDELVIDELLAGLQTPKASNNTLFKDQQVGVTTVSHTFRIYNAGNTDLNLTDVPDLVTVIGTNALDFTVTTQPSTPVNANNGFTDFIIEFNPTDYGVRTATVRIANDNPFENPYTFTVQGTGLDYTACQNDNLIFEDFEDSTVTYTTTVNEASDGFYNYFARYDGTNIGAATSFNNTQGNGYFGVQDTDAAVSENTPYLQFNNLDISGFSSLKLSLFIAEDDDGNNQDWDASSYMHIAYRVDGGTWTNLLWVEATNGANSEPAIDNDFSGVGDLGDEITDTFQLFQRDFDVNGSTLDLSFKFNDLIYDDEDIAIDDIILSGVKSTTWDEGAWSNGVPTRTVKAIIAGNYDTTNGNIEACACTVNSGATLTVNGGEHLLIETDFENNGTVDVKNEGSIVQHKSDAVATGSDKFFIHKTTTSYASYDYIYWSSPLDAETFDNVFAANLAAGEGQRIYQFDTANFLDGNGDTFDDDNNDWSMPAFTDVITPGTGYIVMGTGSTFPLTNPLTINNQTQSVVFQKGVINNGDIVVPVVLDGYNTTNGSGNTFNTNANLIGNPYPSAIDITKLASQVYDATNNPSGVLEGTFYFWTHDTQIGGGSNAGPDLYNFTNDDYAVVTVDNNGNFSNVAGSNGAVTATSQYIASGQGFMANVHVAGNLVFNNNMRVVDNNNTFRNTNTASNMDRVWLNLTKSSGSIFRQIMVGFHDGATDGYKNGQDGARGENGSNTDFYSLIPSDNNHYAIQNLGTFNTTKTIDLGLEIIEDGTYQIAIDHVVGIFAEDQIVYLEDKDTNTIWDLTNNGAYQFVATVGDNINNRFTLRFTTTALGVTDNTISTQLVVARNSNGFDLSTTDGTKIKSAILFNTLGQKLGYYKANNGEVQIPTNNINEGTVLFINVVLDNGATLTKKAVKL